MRTYVLAFTLLQTCLSSLAFGTDHLFTTYPDCENRWDEVKSHIKELHDEKKSTQSRRDVWNEFRGFIHATIEVRPPRDWFCFLAKGDKHRSETGYDSEELPFDEDLKLSLNGTHLAIEGNSAYYDGLIKKLDTNGTEVWKCKIISTDEDQLSLTGVPPKTLWLDLQISSDRKWIHAWGYNETGHCFYQKVNFESGEIGGRLVLELLDDHFWEKSRFFRQGGRKRKETSMNSQISK